jgi:ribosomal protein S15P/S13E
MKNFLFLFCICSSLFLGIYFLVNSAIDELPVDENLVSLYERAEYLNNKLESNSKDSLAIEELKIVYKQISRLSGYD